MMFYGHAFQYDLEFNFLKYSKGLNCDVHRGFNRQHGKRSFYRVWRSIHKSGQTLCAGWDIPKFTNTCQNCANRNCVKSNFKHTTEG